MKGISKVNYNWLMNLIAAASAISSLSSTAALSASVGSDCYPTPEISACVDDEYRQTDYIVGRFGAWDVAHVANINVFELRTHQRNVTIALRPDSTGTMLFYLYLAKSSVHKVKILIGKSEIDLDDLRTDNSTSDFNGDMPRRHIPVVLDALNSEQAALIVTDTNVLPFPLSLTGFEEALQKMLELGQTFQNYNKGVPAVANAKVEYDNKLTVFQNAGRFLNYASHELEKAANQTRPSTSSTPVQP